MDQLSHYPVKVEITEMDVAVKLPATEEGIRYQAETYADVISLMLEYPAFVGLHVWGVDDGHSWVPIVKPGTGEALLLDTTYQPKECYYAALRAVLAA